MTESLTAIPSLRTPGAKLVRAHAGRAEIELDLVADHENSLGVAHGGVVMTPLDVAMARAGRTMVDRDDAGPMVTATVGMKTSFLRPAVGRLLARGRVLHRCATMAYCEAEPLDGNNHLVAKPLCTFKFLRRR